MEKRGAGFQIFKPFFFEIGGRRFGFEYSRVGVGPTPYLDRYITYLGGISLRLHKFWRGDDDRAPHDHPWDFWTFPLRGYWEKVPVCDELTWEFEEENYYEMRPVRAFRFHHRAAKYRHIVVGRLDGKQKPFWTFVVSGKLRNKWGFWPTPTKFVPWREWT
jgi:hypothetical protein